MNYNHILDSSNSAYESKFEIDYKNDKALTILFEKENIVLTADSHGNATFENTDGTKILSGKAECSRIFSEIYCKVQDNVITVRFPVMKTIDHYPNCDGEYDRYSEVIVDNILITCPV
ncbi:MAG: hypothetical protein IJ015_05770 [Ruminococcus sp.]|nr:hypothetical protein [Ruminococcus sp.]